MAGQLARVSGYLLSVCVLFCAGIQSTAGQVVKSTLWRDAVVTELDVDFGDSGFHARWSFHRCDCGDLLIQVEQVDPEGVHSGELLLVGGQVLLARDLEQQGADIKPLIQAPALMLQLAYALLNRSQPKGPDAVGQKQPWDETEETMDFILNSGLATGAFAAPWRVRGSGWKTGSGSRRFELFFQFNVAPPDQSAENGSITFSGNLEFHKKAFPYAESTDLQGWRIQWISRDEPESNVVTENLTLKQLRQKMTHP